MKKRDYEIKRREERKLKKRLGANSDAWSQHKNVIVKRVKRVQEVAHKRALERKKVRTEAHEKRIKEDLVNKKKQLAKEKNDN